MLFFAARHRLIIITKTLQMTQIQVAPDGKVSPFSKVKLSIKAEDGALNAIWAEPGMLVTASGESMLRFWDVSGDENYILTLSSFSNAMAAQAQAQLTQQQQAAAAAAAQDEGKTGGGGATILRAPPSLVSRADRVVRVAYNASRRTIVAGTLEGKLLFWRHNGVRAGGGDSWTPQSVTVPAQGGQRVRELEWGPGDGLIGVGLP